MHYLIIDALLKRLVWSPCHISKIHLICNPLYFRTLINGTNVEMHYIFIAHKFAIQSGTRNAKKDIMRLRFVRHKTSA